MKTKKYKFVNRKQKIIYTKKKNLINIPKIGGSGVTSETEAIYKEVVIKLNKRINDTYSFLPITNGGNLVNDDNIDDDYGPFKLVSADLVLNNSGYLQTPYDFNKTQTISTKIKDGTSGFTNKQSVLKTIETTNEHINKDDFFQKHEILFAEYHGAYRKREFKKLQPNVYLCMLGIFDTSSLLLTNKIDGIDILKKYMNRVTLRDFKLICRYKNLLSSPNLDIATIHTPRSFYIGMDCLSRGQWFFPEQFYPDLDLSINGEVNLEKSSKSNMINGKIKNTVLHNEERVKSLSDFINFIVEPDKNPEKIYIVFSDSCRPNMVIYDTKILKQIPLISYKTQSLNYAVYRTLIEKFFQNIGAKSDIDADLKRMGHFLCASTTSDYLSPFFQREFQSSILTIDRFMGIELPIKNDNYHVYIPRLKYIYDKIIILDSPGLINYFDLNQNNFVFIIQLSFNKLKKFLIKFKSNCTQPSVFHTFINYINTNKIFCKFFSYYNSNFDKFTTFFNSYDESKLGVYGNMKLFKYISDYIDISSILQPESKDKFGVEIHDEIVQKLKASSFSNALFFFPGQTTNENINKLILNGFNIDPFIYLEESKIKERCNILTEIKCLNLKRTVFDKYFNINMLGNSLKILHIDDVIFDFDIKPSGISTGVDNTKLSHILSKFKNIPHNSLTNHKRELIIKDVYLDPPDDYVYNFIDFSIVNVTFNIFGGNNRVNFEFKDSNPIDIKITNCSIGKIDLIRCYNISINLDHFYIEEDNNPLIPKPENIKMIKLYKFRRFDLGSVISANKIDFGKFRYLTHLELIDIGPKLEFNDDKNIYNLQNLEHLEIEHCTLKYNKFFNLNHINLKKIRLSYVKSDLSSGSFISDTKHYINNPDKSIIINNSRLNFNIYIYEKIKKIKIEMKDVNHFHLPHINGMVYKIGNKKYRDIREKNIKRKY